MFQTQFDLDGRYVEWRVVELLPPLYGVHAKFMNQYGVGGCSPKRLQIQVFSQSFGDPKPPLEGASGDLTSKAPGALHRPIVRPLLQRKNATIWTIQGISDIEQCVAKALIGFLTVCTKATIDDKAHKLAHEKSSRILNKQLVKGSLEELSAEEEAIIAAGWELEKKLSVLWLSHADELADSGAILRSNVVVSNRLGLHARPTAMFMKVANRFKSAIFLCRDDCVGDGKDSMDVMMLAAGQGSVLKIFAVGADAKSATAERLELFGRRFDDE